MIKTLIHLCATSYTASEAGLEGLAKIYRELGKELVDKSLCNSCGDCCNFNKFDHELRLTHLELLYLIQKHGLKRPSGEGVCPYLEGGLCGAREGRALGCRIFFCEADKARQEKLYEKYIGKIRNLIANLGTDAYYGELLVSLGDVRL